MTTSSLAKHSDTSLVIYGSLNALNHGACIWVCSSGYTYRSARQVLYDDLFTRKRFCNLVLLLGKCWHHETVAHMHVMRFGNVTDVSRRRAMTFRFLAQDVYSSMLESAIISDNLGATRFHEFCFKKKSIPPTNLKLSRKSLPCARDLSWSKLSACQHCMVIPNIGLVRSERPRMIYVCRLKLDIYLFGEIHATSSKKPGESWLLPYNSWTHSGAR